MTVDAKHAKQVLETAQCLYSMQQVEQAISGLAESISQVLKDKDPVIMCVMNGGLVLTGKLLTQLNFPLTVDYIHATRYRKQTRGGKLKWLVKPHSSLENQTVLIVDDILDEGDTLAAVIEYCKTQGARQVLSVVLVKKQHNRNKKNTQADFIALQVEDRYVFGYGMDYKGRLRNADGIYAVSE